MRNERMSDAMRLPSLQEIICFYATCDDGTV